MHGDIEEVPRSSREEFAVEHNDEGTEAARGSFPRVIWLRRLLGSMSMG